MQNVWDKGAPWGPQVPKVQKAIQKWNKEVFGNIFERKRKLINRLEEVAHNLTITPSAALDNIHKNIWREYEQVLFKEEVL